MSDEDPRKQRAIECVTKYRDTLTSPERIAAFAVWFAEQEFGWKDVRKEPPTDMMLVLLKDTKLNVVRLGYRTGGGGWSVSDRPMRYLATASIALCLRASSIPKDYYFSDFTAFGRQHAERGFDQPCSDLTGLK